MTKPVNMIVVDADGDIITAANGKVSSSDPELVKLVKRNAQTSLRVQLVAPFGQKVQPSLDPNNLIGITAALYSARPGRTRLLEAPPEVMEWFRKERASRGSCMHGASSSEEFEFRGLDEIARNFVEDISDKNDESDK